MRRRAAADFALYHASPRRFRRGDVLEGGREGGAGYAHEAVCMSDTPAPHGTVSTRAIAENWYVYRVRPHRCRAAYVEGNGEYQADRAEVLELVGRADALSRRYHPGAVRGKYAGPDGRGEARDVWVSYASRPRPMRGVRVHPLEVRLGYGACAAEAEDARRRWGASGSTSASRRGAR